MKLAWRLAALKNGFQDATAYRAEFFLEILGSLDSKKNLLNIKNERVDYWLTKGAKPTATVTKILQK